MTKTKTILPGAWEIIQDEPRELFSLHVPPSWRQVANNLAQQRAKSQGKGFRSVPVYSLDPLITACFPQIIKTMRKGWQKPGVPWLFALLPADLTDLPLLIKDWLMAEFSESLGESFVNSINNLNDKDWHWEEPKIYSLLRQPQGQHEIDVRFEAIPDYLAQEFLNQPTVSFNGKELTFYRVVRLNKGAELMSWPPHQVLVSKGKDRTDTAFISFVIRFVLQTVPWRKDPIINHQLSVRRWIPKPLVTKEKNRIPYRGATAYIGDHRRWLDGQRQDFCFIPLAMKRQHWGGEVEWPKAISKLLLLNDSGLPDPITLASDPVYNWSEFGSIPSGIQAAISYDTRHQSKPPSKAGLNRRDFDDLDRAIQERLPVKRVGKALIVNPPSRQRRFWKPGSPTTPMLRPQIAAPAVFRQSENPLRTVLIVWETRECRDRLIAEICRLLSLSPKGQASIYKISPEVQGEEQIYEGSLGSLCIKTQHVGDLTQDFDINNTEIPGKTRQKRRTHLLDERIKKIEAYLPLTEELCGALVEIRPLPLIPEADPKLAWRIGAIRAGYLNQHIFAMEFQTDRESGEQKLTQSSTERVQRAVSDLLRQFGILPNQPLINPEIDGIEPHVWLTCFYVLRRTKKTTATGIPNTVVLMVRVNPVTAFVEFTTPDLFWEKLKGEENRWVSNPVLLKQLVSENWEPDSYFDETEEISEEEQQKEKEREQNLLSKFVGECLQDCLNTPIASNENPRVLFMASAQNARLKLPWLQNPNLPATDLPQQLKKYIGEKQKNRLWIVRLRLGENGETPVAIVKDTFAMKASGIYRWQGVCDDGERSLYLSIGRPPKTAKFLLRKSQSRLDSGTKPTWNARILEIAVVHYPEIQPDTLAHFVHSLRSRWPYFADDVSHPLPFPFATKAKEYAVSAKDSVEFLESDDTKEQK